MKKLLALLMAVVLCVSLTACGGGDNSSETTAPTEATMTQEEMLEQIDYSDVDSMLSDIDSNVVRAIEKYEGKIMKIDNFKVKSITPNDDYVSVQMQYRTFDLFLITARLSKEDALTINVDDSINIVGVLNDIKANGVILNNAFLINK